MIKEHERVVLTMDLPDYRLETGDIGTVVHVYNQGQAYEVEFFTLNGQTLDVVTVEAAQVRTVRSTEVLHARTIR